MNFLWKDVDKCIPKMMLSQRTWLPPIERWRNKESLWHNANLAVAITMAMVSGAITRKL